MSAIIQVRNALLAGNVDRAENLFRRCKDSMRGKIAKFSMDNSKLQNILHLIAGFGGRPEFARSVIAHGAPKNAKDVNGWSPLFVAVARRNIPVVRELISAGVESTRSRKTKSHQLLWHLKLV